MKYFLTTLSLITLTIVVNAQTQKDRMRIMIGIGAPNIPAAVLENVDTKTGPLQIGYKVFLTPRLSVGLLYNYSSAKTKPALSYTENFTPYIFSSNVKFNTFLSQLDFAWINKPNYNWYSGVSLGWVNSSYQYNLIDGNVDIDEKVKTRGSAYHITLVGYHGTLGKGIGVYSELGFGFNGIWNGGFTYSFN
jgi:hypothetical protein